jgi:hypothetical protein
MFNLAALHAKRKDPRPLSAFYKTAGCRAASEYLRNHRALSDEQVLKKKAPHRGQPAECMAHPLMVLEYLRWANEPMYFAKLEMLLDRSVREANAA